MKIYVASSWKNSYQPNVVNQLNFAGHNVYDFRHPSKDDNGFSWSEIDPNWKEWTPNDYRIALTHSAAKRGYQFDIGALKWCECCVLVLPSGRSASWEFGYAMGAGKKGIVYMPERCEPELMYSDARIVLSIQELLYEVNHE